MLTKGLNRAYNLRGRLDWNQIGWVDLDLVFLLAAREEGYAVWNDDGDRVFLFDGGGSLVTDYSYTRESS